MSTIAALLVVLISFIEGNAGVQPSCTSESWEDHSAVYTCATDNVVCTAWVDAETQRLAGVECK